MLALANSHIDGPLRYSLWLVPDLKSAEPLQLTIDNIAAKYKSLPFYPHMTVYSPLTESVLALTPKLEDFACSNKPLQLRGKAFSHREIFYQSLFIELDVSYELQQFHKNAVNIFGHDSSTVFFPHVSLAYLDPRSFNADNEITHLDDSLLLDTRYDRLVLMATNGKQKDWAKILEIKLNDE